jgi:hypothetical protein
MDSIKSNSSLTVHTNSVSIRAVRYIANFQDILLSSRTKKVSGEVTGAYFKQSENNAAYALNPLTNH